MPDPAVIASAFAVMLGRLILGGYFVFCAIRHFRQSGAILPLLAERGVPAPRAMLVAANVFLLLAGGSLALGLLVVLPAVLLAAFTLGVSVLMLDFWNLPEGAEREGVFRQFLTNIALTGGLIVAAGA